MKIRCLLFIVCLSLFVPVAFGQTDRGTITGTVSDATAAVIPGVAIEAKNVQTGAVYQGGSSETGNYTLAQLPAGTYELSAGLPGFKRFVRSGVIVSVATVLRIDVTLEVGAEDESVTVEAASPLLKTESGEVSHNISYNNVNDLPVLTLSQSVGQTSTLGNVRNPLQVLNLVPGASFANDNQLRVNGMPSATQAIRIEGQDATNGRHRQYNQGVQASVEAIQEVAIQTSNYAAEFGQAGGGYFNYTMRSGTNRFHGGVYDYFVNEALNAGTPFTDRINTGDVGRAGEHIRNAQRKNDYGFSFGGPIWLGKLYDGHDKSFFFFNFEQFRETQFINTGIATVPTLAYRSGDFSRALQLQLTLPDPTDPTGVRRMPAFDPLGNPVFQNAIYDPRTTQLAPNGSVVRDQFRNNTIPQELMDPVALRIQSMIPLPTNNDLTNNYQIPGYSNFRHTTIPSFKIDHNFNQKNHLSWYFQQTHTVSPNANGFTQPFTDAISQNEMTYITRVNYDRTISPSTMLHVGVGYFQYNWPQVLPDFDQSKLGWAKNYYVNMFPNIGGIFNATRGGFSPGIGQTLLNKYLKDIKPTANTNLTMVKGNHSYKLGGELIIEGFPTVTYSRATGVYTFSPQQSALPWEDGQPLNNTTGFGYASFLLGYPNSMNAALVTNVRLGNHSLAGYFQDSWKVTRKLTLEYGLRYDFVTLHKEQYGRMQSADFKKPNPLVGNLPGSVIYEATCNCSFNRNYPYAFGPRFALAYQIGSDSKTVLRLGSGIIYGTAPNLGNVTRSAADFYTLGVPGYGLNKYALSDGNPLAEGNAFGNPSIFFPDFRQKYPYEIAPGLRPPQSPFISIDRNAGRPPRQIHWSIGLQREVMPNLMVEASYVGNRGVWWAAPLLAKENYNSYTPEGLKAAWGLDITNATDRGLLTLPIRSPQVIARFPKLADPNNVYPGFPSDQSLIQALRPHPQWIGIPPFLGPPLGDTWYDSLQAKATQRFSRGLTGQVAFTWQKELVLGTGTDTSYLVPGNVIINDVFDYKQNKQISPFSRPLMLVIAFNYTTPGFKFGNGAASKVLSSVVRDWAIGSVLRYQSGEVLRVPASNNNLLRQLGRGPENNPATWGGGTTLFNRVPDKPLFLKDPNCQCIDPTKDLVLNKDAWVDAPPGQFGTTAPYLNDYRWQRQPSESMSFGRNFFVNRERNVKFEVRAEFYNVFNRLFLSSPEPVKLSGGGGGILVGANPAATPTVDNQGLRTGGFGFVNWVGGAGSQPRSGQVVARVTF
jgi:Carboxypeptidase regulatory-like domain